MTDNATHTDTPDAGNAIPHRLKGTACRFCGGRVDGVGFCRKCGGEQDSPAFAVLALEMVDGAYKYPVHMIGMDDRDAAERYAERMRVMHPERRWKVAPPTEKERLQETVGRLRKRLEVARSPEVHGGVMISLDDAARLLALAERFLPK